MFPLATNVRTRREAMGMTAREAAHLAGITPAYWSHLERGKSTGSIPSLTRVAKVLKCTLDDLVRDDG